VPELLGLPEQLTGLDRCLVMGVLNVTPDSFSDGGRYDRPGSALAHAEQMVADGADLVDVGGESTRVAAGDELDRVLPVVRALVGLGAVVSIDTMRSEVARAALDEGAAIVNDISGGLADPGIAAVVAAAGVPFVAMHWRGHSTVMEDLTFYEDVVAEVVAHFEQRLDALEGAGLDRRQVILDPGFGFAKKPEHSWRLLASLDAMVALGRPLLVGTSRKRFLAGALTHPERRTTPADRDPVTAATSALAAAAGAWGVRVHDVAASADAVRVAATLAACRRGRV
jgi:dihydropteroate synthase